MTLRKLMKSKVIFALLLTSVLFFTACSYGYDFVVVNASDKPIDVRYLVNPSGRPPERRTHIPAVLEAGELQKSKRTWKDLPAEQHNIDHKSGEIVVKLAPNQALRVADITNYPGHDSEHTDLYFHISSLSLTGARGSVKYEGRQALTQFKGSETLYVITYQ